MTKLYKKTEDQQKRTKTAVLTKNGPKSYKMNCFGHENIFFLNSKLGFTGIFPVNPAASE